MSRFGRTDRTRSGTRTADGRYLRRARPKTERRQCRAQSCQETAPGPQPGARHLETATPPDRQTAEKERKSKATDRTTANSAAQHERKEQLKALLTEHHGNVAAVARVMGKACEQVYRWIKASGLNPEDFRKETQS